MCLNQYEPSDRRRRKNSNVEKTIDRDGYILFRYKIYYVDVGCFCNLVIEMAALRNNETLTLQNINTKFQQGKRMHIIEKFWK